MADIQVKDKLITLEELAAAYNSITPSNIGAVPLSGTGSNPMTGNLDITRESSNANIRIKTNVTGVTLWMYNTTNGKHGIYSDGYYDGSAFNSSGKYMISRGNDGKVTVDNHYNKTETVEQITNRVGTFTAPANATLAINMTSGLITDNTAKSNIDIMFTNLPIGFSARYGTFGGSGTFLMLISKTSSNYGAVKCIGYVDTEYTWIKFGADNWTCKKLTLVNV